MDCPNCSVKLEWPPLINDETWFGKSLFNVSIRAESGLSLPKQGGKGILKQKEFPKFHMSLSGWKIGFSENEPLIAGTWEDIVSFEENSELSGARKVSKSPLVSKGLIKTVVNYQLTGAGAIGESIGESMFNKTDADKRGGVLAFRTQLNGLCEIEFLPGGFAFSGGEQIAEFHPSHWFKHALYICSGIGKVFNDLDFSTLEAFETPQSYGLIFPAIYIGGHGPNLPSPQSNVCVFLSPKGIWIGGAIIPWSWVQSFEVGGKGEYGAGESLTNIYSWGDHKTNANMKLMADIYNKVNFKKRIDTTLRLSTREGEANLRLYTVSPANLDIFLGPLRSLLQKEGSSSGNESKSVKKFCQYCGQRIQEVSKYCASCGEKVD